MIDAFVLINVRIKFVFSFQAERWYAMNDGVFAESLTNLIGSSLCCLLLNSVRRLCFWVLYVSDECDDFQYESVL